MTDIQQQDLTESNVGEYKFPDEDIRKELEHPAKGSEQTSALYGDLRRHHKHFGLDHTKTSTGIIWATQEAAKKGLYDEPHLWGNLGQGAPETGELEGEVLERPKTITMTTDDLEYGPVSGIKSLREAVANLYNDQFRKGKESQYTWENVCIVPGGRAGLTRIAAVLGNVYVGFYIPDYTAYNEMLSMFKNFSAIPTPLEKEDGYHLNIDSIKGDLRRGIAAIITSNPRNPTGNVTKGKDLKEIQDLCRGRATLIFDEFYSGYQYSSGCDGTTISAAEYVEDVNDDDVLIVDGLTKRFRLPGWRIAWVIGPKQFISALGCSGSFLDGGANVPFQEAAVHLVKDPAKVKIEMSVLQSHFIRKRDYVIDRLKGMGFEFQTVPEATFYIWLDLSSLPPAINNGMAFFRACLEEKVVTVPGIYFDLNPSHRRDLFDSPAHHFVRLSYGPNIETLKRALDGMERVIEKAKSELLEEKEGEEEEKEEREKHEGRVDESNDLGAF